MTALTRWNPFRDIHNFQDEFNSMLNVFNNLGYGIDRNQPVSWIPPVDIEESGDKLYLRAELPGMKPEDIDISFENGVLSLRGERRFENESGQKNYHRVERSYGSFVRSFTLPASVDADKVIARYHDGVLELEMPKRDEAKARKISINGAGAQKQIEK